MLLNEVRWQRCQDLIIDRRWIMEKIVRQGLLYDFYGALLNDHRKNIYEAYVYDNMSLSEIANEHGISRQGVHDLIKRCDESLEVSIISCATVPSLMSPTRSRMPSSITRSGL